MEAATTRTDRRDAAELAPVRSDDVTAEVTEHAALVVIIIFEYYSCVLCAVRWWDLTRGSVQYCVLQ